jgi:hypothetical protein
MTFPSELRRNAPHQRQHAVMVSLDHALCTCTIGGAHMHHRVVKQAAWRLAKY